MPIKGQCLCGAVRYTIDSEPLATRACWCRLCQYLGAGSGTVNGMFKRDSVMIQGETRDYASMADSGSHMHRQFCPICGTPMFGYADERAQLLVVRVGTMDDPSAVPPATTIWTSQAPTWACINGNLPQVKRQPPPVG